MREIKFRARALMLDKRWVYGSYIFDPLTGRHQILDWENNVFVAVDPNTVSQYTGLKDKNGVEIFEGDLVECYTKSGELVYSGGHEVKIPDFYQEIWSFADYGLPAKLGESTVVKVIGNIYENLELLK